MRKFTNVFFPSVAIFVKLSITQRTPPRGESRDLKERERNACGRKVSREEISKSAEQPVRKWPRIGSTSITSDGWPASKAQTSRCISLSIPFFFRAVFRSRYFSRCIPLIDAPRMQRGVVPRTNRDKSETVCVRYRARCFATLTDLWYIYSSFSTNNY